MSPSHSTMAAMITLSMLSFLVLGDQKDVNLLESTCKGTPNYQLCITTLKRDPRSTSADVAGLAIIIVDALKAKTQEAIAQINGLSKTSPGLRGPLNKCAEVYGVVLKYDISVAIEALTKGNPKFAENGVADAAVEAQICEGNFGKSKSPLTSLNKAVQDLANVARAIIRTLL